MEQKIKEVQDYFKLKILNSQFTITNKTEHTWILEIDDKYTFEVWMLNGAAQRKPSHVHGNTFMELWFTDAEGRELDVILSPLYKRWIKETLLEKKRQELEELEKGIE